MNANQMINLAMRLFGRRLIQRGVDAGIDHYAKHKKGTAQGAQNSAQTQDFKKRARQITRLMRRF